MPHIQVTSKRDSNPERVRLVRELHLMDSPAVLTVSAPVCEFRGVLGAIL